MLNFAKALRLGGQHVDAVHLDHHRVWPLPRPFLEPRVGEVTTPDRPVDYLDGSIRLRTKIRVESVPTATAVMAMQRAAGATNIAWDYYTDATLRLRWRVSTTGTGLILSTTPLPDGSLVPGNDQFIGVRWEQVGPGSVTIGEMSTDGGATWTEITNVARVGALDPFDSTAPITVGGLTGGATRFPGRIYWAEMLAILRARLVFPGVPFNFLSVPDAPNLNITNDVQVVARLQRPASTSPTTQRIVSKDTGNAAGNRGWTAALTNLGQLGFAMLPAAGLLTTAGTPVAAGAMHWVRMTRANATGAVVFEWAPDSPTEPTTGWTTMTSGGTPQTGAIPVTTGPVHIGDRSTIPGVSLEPFLGRIARVIVRDGATTVLDVHENDAGKLGTATTFPVRSGQTVTVVGTGNLPNLNAEVGTVSTPDAPDFNIYGDVRISARVRPEFDIGSLDLTIGSQWPPAPADNAWFLSPRSTGFMWGRYDQANTRADVQAMTLAETQAVLQRGVDAYIGVEVTTGGAGAGVAGITSVDGRTWTRVRKVLQAPFRVRDTTGPITVGSHGTAPWRGRLYWMQMEAINRVRFMFPGVAGNYMTVPNPWLATGRTGVEVIARVSAPWQDPVTDFEGIVYLTSTLGIRRTSTAFQWYMYDGAGVASTASVALAQLPAWTNGQTVWLRCTVSPNMTFQWAPDSEAIPTTWTDLRAPIVPPNAGVRTSTGSTALIGADASAASSRMWRGAIRRVIMRDAAGGTTLLDVNDVDANQQTTTSFPATTGGTVTVVQTAGVTLLQPQAERVVWRFDASEYPGTGTTFTDPRGRVWTLSAAGAIVPAVAPIPQPQPDSTIWRFDANEWPPGASSVVDANGRTWSVAAPAAVAHPASQPDSEVHA